MQYGWTLETLCGAEEARHRRLCTLCFCLYEFLEKVKLTYSDRKRYYWLPAPGVELSDRKMEKTFLGDKKLSILMVI